MCKLRILADIQYFNIFNETMNFNNVFINYLNKCNYIEVYIILTQCNDIYDESY